MVGWIEEGRLVDGRARARETHEAQGQHEQREKREATPQHYSNSRQRLPSSSLSLLSPLRVEKSTLARKSPKICLAPCDTASSL